MKTKNILHIILFLLLTFSIVKVQAQEEAAPTTPPATSISKGLGLFVFPSNNQTQEQLDADELECYKWAMNQTNYDPLNPTKVVAEAADTSLDGSAVVGSAKGAAAGAAIGAIAGDAGKGAAIGAVAGGLRGRRARKYGDAVEQQQNEQAAAATNQEMADNYNKAFSACLEGKGYTVK
jgi:outer membrane protein with glycine zipper